MANWEKCDGYLELRAPQRTDAWFAERKFRCTASVASILVTGESKFTTFEKCLGLILGTEIPDKPNVNMTLGTLGEDPAIANYIEKTKRKVDDVSLCLPLWGTDPLDPDWFIAGSPDGLVTDGDSRGNLEIKCPVRTYYNLKRRLEGPYGDERITKGRSGKREGRDPCPHIFISHYMQMQQCMAVTGRKWCDYLVHSYREEDPVYLERIHFNEGFWRDLMYPELRDVIQEELIPRLNPREIEWVKERNLSTMT